MIAALVAVALTASPTPSASPSPQPLPPVAVELCVAETQSPSNPNLKVGLSFRNVSGKPMSSVAFDIYVVDASDHVVSVQRRSIDGTFAPNVLVQPRRSPLTQALLTQPEYPDSPAWNIANHFGSGATSVRCFAAAVTFADGTVWHAGR